MTNTPPPPVSGSNPPLPASQGQKVRRRREGWAEWMRDLPLPRFPDKPEENFRLIDPAKLDALLANANENAAARIREDIEFLNAEMMTLFRDRDHNAKKEQNLYRAYQISYLALAGVATALGSFQAILLLNRPDVMPWIAFAETFVALLATFLATISGREPPMPRWLENRRRAEQLRREYFRFLVNLPPYDEEVSADEVAKGFTYEIKRKLLLSERIAEINRGAYPGEPNLG